MDKRITFGTKADLNKIREEEFLALTEVQRLELFFARMNMHNKLFGKTEKPNNLILERNSIDRI